MDFLFWFSVGFLAHRIFVAVKDHVQHPYKWTCQGDGCQFRARTDSPDTLARITLAHQNVSHPRG